MKTIKKLFSYLLTITMVLTLFVPTLSAKAASYDYTISGVKRNISVVDGKTTLTVGDKSYELTKKLVAADAALDQYGTAWILFKNGAIYWWNYDLENTSSMITIHGLTSSTGNQVYAAQFLFEGDDDVTVTGYQTASGSKYSLLSLEDVKKLLNASSSTDNSDTGDNNNGSSSDGGNTSIEDNNNGSSSDSSNTSTGNDNNTGNTSTGDNSNTTNNTTDTNNSTTNGSVSDTSSSTSTITTDDDTKVTVTTTTTTTTDEKGNTTKTSSTVTKTEKVKCTRVTHNGSYYHMWSNSTKLTTAKLRKGKLTWRGYSCKNIKKIGFIKKSKNLIAITKTGKVFTLKYDDMTKKYVIGSKGVKKYGKAVAFNYDKHGFVTHVVTKKPKRINVKNK